MTVTGKRPEIRDARENDRGIEGIGGENGVKIKGERTAFSAGFTINETIARGLLRKMRKRLETKKSGPGAR